MQCLNVVIIIDIPNHQEKKQKQSTIVLNSTNFAAE